MSLDPNPKQRPAYAPTDERYWDEDDFTREIHRIFDICHSCRMCLSYCPSFPDLFARVDGYIAKGQATGAETLDNEDIASVVDHCFQCKICYIKCPYTEDEGHPWLLDFPRIALREKALRARRDGVTVQDRVLGEPQLLGELTAGPQAHVANLVSASSLVRKATEKLTGVSAKFPLPKFATLPFPRWFARHEAPEGVGENGEVVLFATCYLDYNTTGPAIAAVKVLEHNGVRVLPSEGVTCCGMPNLDGGDIGRAQDKARQNVAALLQHAREGRSIVVPGPTCSYMMSKEYPGLLEGDDAKLVASKVVDLSRWIDQHLRRPKKLKKDFQKPLGKVALQAPCHLRAQKIAFPAVQLLEAAGAEVEVVPQCSAVDGTWGMKAQYYALGRRYALKMVRDLRGAGAASHVTDGALSGLRIHHELGGQVRHPLEAMAMAYGLDDEKRKETDHEESGTKRDPSAG